MRLNRRDFVEAVTAAGMGRLTSRAVSEAQAVSTKTAIEKQAMTDCMTFGA